MRLPYKDRYNCAHQTDRKGAASCLSPSDMECRSGTVERQNGIIAGQKIQKGGKNIFLIGGVLGKELVDAQKTAAPCGAADQVEIRARRREAGCLNIKKNAVFCKYLVGNGV